jgi:hypothetical protein
VIAQCLSLVSLGTQRLGPQWVEIVDLHGNGTR